MKNVKNSVNNQSKIDGSRLLTLQLESETEVESKGCQLKVSPKFAQNAKRNAAYEKAQEAVTRFTSGRKVYDCSTLGRCYDPSTEVKQRKGVRLLVFKVY